MFVLYRQTSISRDFVHINDVVNSIIAALKYLPKQLHTIFNVGSGIPTPVTKIAELLKQEMGKSFDVVNDIMLHDIIILYYTEFTYTIYGCCSYVCCISL